MHKRQTTFLVALLKDMLEFGQDASKGSRLLISRTERP